MKRAIISILSVVVVLSLVEVIQGGVVYQSDFTGTTLASAGLAKSAGAAGGGWAIDDPNDQLDGYGSGNGRASVYTSDSWQNDLGFALEVTFRTSAAMTRFSFGIVDADWAIPSAQDWLNESPAGAYGIGFTTSGSGSATDHLAFNNDAGTLTELSTAQGNATVGATFHTMSITVTADSWSYSLNGAAATTGSHTFDTSRDFRFISYGQKARFVSFSNITISELPPVTWDGSDDTTWTAPDATSWGGGVYHNGADAQFLGDGSGTVTLSGTIEPGSVTVNSANDYTFSGDAIGGSGTLTKEGTGTLTISNANTYTGGTTLSNGTLIVGNSEAIGTGTLTLDGGTLRNDATAVTLNEAINVSGTTAVFAASAGLALSGDITGAGTLNIGGSGSGQGGASVSIRDNLDGFTGTLRYDSVLNLNGFSFGDGNTVVTDAALEVNGSAANIIRLWEHATFGELSGSGGYFSGDNSTLTINQDTDTTFGGQLMDVNSNRELGLTKNGTGRLTLTNTGSSYEWATKVNGGTLEVQGRINETASITVAGGATFEVTGAGSLGNASGVYAGGGSGSGNITINGTFSYNSTTDQECSGAISGSGALTKTNTSTLTLSGANTYTGTTTIDGGTLLLSQAGNPATGPQGTITINNGGTLAFGTYNQLTRVGPYPDVVVNSGGVIDSSATVTMFGNITLNGGTMQGNGGFSDVWGAFAVTDTITVTADSSIQAVSGSNNYLSPGGEGHQTLTLDVSGGATLTNELGIVDLSASDVYTLVKDGAGTAILSGANTYTGLTSVDGGTLVLAASGALSSGNYAINNDATLQTTVALTTGSRTFTFGDADSGSIVFTVGNMKVGGTTFVTTGGPVNYISGALLDLGAPTYDVADGTDDVDLVVGNSHNRCGFVKDGAGTLRLTSTHNNLQTYSIDLNAGVLEIGEGGKLKSGSYSGAIANDGIFRHNSTGDQTLGGVISGTGSLEKDNSSTLTLSGACTYSGYTTINGGVLRLASGGSLNTATRVQIASPGKMQLDVDQTVDSLDLDGLLKRAGTWGASGSGAANIDNAHFSGGGILTVSNGPGGTLFRFK